ncbi:universal stress protein [soil metagenome]
MKDRPIPSPAVVVGVDGSHRAVDAALWAVEEAISRDIPLRLLYAIEPRPSLSAEQAARDLANAEIAVRQVFMAVESLELPIKVEVEIVQDRPEHALINASRAATMLVLGALGVNHATGHRYGSVAAALSHTAHCPVAIVRRAATMSADSGWIVAEVNTRTTDSRVLESALAEALLRNAPLRVLTTTDMPHDDSHDGGRAAELARMTSAKLEKDLSYWRRRYPELDIDIVTAPGLSLNYVAQHSESIQLVVVDQRDSHALGSAAGPAAHAVLRDSNCSVLICERRNAL